MKLYIGNLPYDTTEEEIREALAEFEPIEDLYFPLDKVTGRRRGFAFVRLSNREIGEEAIRRLDGADFGGRNLRVSEAEERTDGGGGGGHRGGGGGGGHRGGGRGDRGGGGGGYRGDRDRGDRDRGDRGDRKRY